jgi:hypothetical protein
MIPDPALRRKQRFVSFGQSRRSGNPVNLLREGVALDNSG